MLSLAFLSYFHFEAFVIRPCGKRIYDIFLFYFKLILMIDGCYIYVELSIWWIHEITIWSLCIFYTFKFCKFSAKNNHMNVMNARWGLSATFERSTTSVVIRIPESGSWTCKPFLRTNHCVFSYGIYCGVMRLCDRLTCPC